MKIFPLRVIHPEVLRNGLDSAFLVWDSAPCHQTPSIEEKLIQCKTRTILVPPNMTGLLQPADVCLFRSFKLFFRRRYMDWFVNEPKSFTNFGNLRSPGYAAVVEWVSDIWRNLDEQLIFNSFDLCGITSQNNLHKVLNNIYKTEQLLGEIVETDVEADDEADFRVELNNGILLIFY